MPSGGCHCGAVRYEMTAEVAHHALCHCTDCRKASGAPATAWAMAAADQVTITGEPLTYASSEHGRRLFCGACGTGLFYTNDVVFPGMIDVQSATLDDPDAIPLQARKSRPPSGSAGWGIWATCPRSSAIPGRQTPDGAQRGRTAMVMRSRSPSCRSTSRRATWASSWNR